MPAAVIETGPQLAQKLREAMEGIEVAADDLEEHGRPQHPHHLAEALATVAFVQGRLARLEYADCIPLSTQPQFEEIPVPKGG